jgi:hypothetical protein
MQAPHQSVGQRVRIGDGTRLDVAQSDHQTSERPPVSTTAIGRGLSTTGASLLDRSGNEQQRPTHLRQVELHQPTAMLGQRLQCPVSNLDTPIPTHEREPHERPTASTMVRLSLRADTQCLTRPSAWATHSFLRTHILARPQTHTHHTHARMCADTNDESRSGLGRCVVHGSAYAHI